MPKTIEEETPLLPWIVSDRVIGEVSQFLQVELDRNALGQVLTTRAETVYARNVRFRKQIKGNSGREYLYCFMRHWLYAALPETIRHKLPSSFANGLELPVRV